MTTSEIDVVEADDDEKRDSLLEGHLLGEEQSVVILKSWIAVHPIDHALSLEGGEWETGGGGGGDGGGIWGGGDET